MSNLGGKNVRTHLLTTEEKICGKRALKGLFDSRAVAFLTRECQNLIQYIYIKNRRSFELLRIDVIVKVLRKLYFWVVA